ncbi:hypothetical protein OESDEN_01682 [Oesophagostomum dentatum]|uniref:Uncharacterized protein n=1 Tax=Oesophagostomum dentatum TaxID=61180 RepID=A0A0B1TM38_OESDE|nr:hypothetical protein OESDEN_01682 [Oesophagostomum dentatum]
MQKLSPRRPSTVDVRKPSGAFQQAGLVREGDDQDHEEAIPVRPTPPVESVPSKPKEITRNGGFHQSDISRIALPTELDEDLKQSLGTIEIEKLLTTETPELEEEEAHNEEQETTTQTTATTLGRRLYTDIADNPNIIHPFPVPFLKKQSVVHQASRVKSGIETSTPEVERHTLPPSIVIAPRRPASKESEQNIVDDGERFEQFALHSQTTVQAKENNVEQPRAPPASRLASPTFIVVVCLTVVAVVMVSVIVGLCTIRHRQIGRFTSTYSESSAARTNAYVSAQAAQMNVIYGTLERDRNMCLSRPDDVQPWLYNPGHNYCNYYK